MSSSSAAAATATAVAVPTPVVLLILSIDHHLSELFAIPTSQSALIARLIPYHEQEINYFVDRTQDDPEAAIVRLLSEDAGGGEDSDDDDGGSDDDSGVKDSLTPFRFNSTQLPITIQQVINISMPMM